MTPQQMEDRLDELRAIIKAHGCPNFENCINPALCKRIEILEAQG